MQSYYNDNEYSFIVSDIMEDKDFNKLKDIKHHGLNRLDHSIRVSYYSYKISKLLGLDSVSVARAGLLHDFFLEENEAKSIPRKIKNLVEHSEYALKNSKEKFELNEKEENIIVSHMFPVSFHLPKYLESWIVDLVDDGVAIWEAYKSTSYSLKPITNLLIFIIVGLFKI